MYCSALAAQERYDDSSAVIRLLQSRRRASREQNGPGSSLLGELGREALLLEEEGVAPIVEDSGQEEDGEENQAVTNFVIFEQQEDENTLI